MEPFRAFLVCLLAIGCLVEVSLAKHKHHRSHYEDDEDHHYLPPHEKDEEPYYHKEKHTSERVVYHKDEEQDKRVDHYHHYDKQPEVKTQHIHYQQPIPQLRTTEILAPAASQIVTRRRRPNRVLYASAPNSVFHTQINVQSQDSELNSQIRPDGAPIGAQLPANAQGPVGGQLPANALPNCQFPVAGNPPIGCRVFDPPGGQLPANAFPPGGQLPANAAPPGGQLPAGGLPAGGQLPANAFPPGGQLPAGGLPAGGQLPANAFPQGGQLPANGAPPGGQLPANAFPQGGQLPSNAFPAGGLQAGGQLGNGNNFFVDPSLGAQLGVGQGAGNGNQNGASQGFAQNLFNPAIGGQLGAQAPVVQRPSSVLIQFDPAIGAQLPASAQAPAAGNPNQGGPIFGAQLGTGQAPVPNFGAQLGNGQQPILGAQLGTGQAPVAGPVFGAQLGTGQAPAGQQPILGAQLGTGQAPVAGPVLGAQLPVSAQAPGGPNQNQFDPTFGGQLPANGNRRFNSGRRNGRLRSNYQGLNVVNGNVFGQPNLQGPTNAVGNQQDTNIIDGNFYSYPGYHQHRLVRVNGNRRAVFLTGGDYVDDYDTDATPTDIGFAASSPELSYAVPEGRTTRHKDNFIADHETAASEHKEYREDGYHYKNPRRTK